VADRYNTFGSYLQDAIAGQREFSRDYRAEQALRALSQNPNDPTAQAGVMATNPGQYVGIMNAQTAQRRAAMEAEQQAATIAAHKKVGELLGAPGSAQVPAASPTSIAAPNPLRASPSPIGGAPVAGQPSAQPAVASAPDEITVTANTPKLTPQQQIAQLYAQDPTGEVTKQFMAIQSHVASLGESERKQLSDKVDTFAAAVPQLASIPYEQRRAAIDNFRPQLLAHGWSQAEIDAFDPTDANLSTLGNQALGYKEVLNQQDKAAQRAETVREHDRDHADAAASRAVSMRGQNMTDARQREFNSITNGATGKQARKAETDLRKEFEALPDVKQFRDVRSAFQQVRQLAKSANGQTDNALVYSYMKMLDPGSVVREGEFALAAKAAGLPDRITNYFGRLDNGQFLNPKMRQEIAAAAGQVYKQRRETYNSTAQKYQGYAKDYGIDPSRVAQRFVPVAKADHGPTSGWKIERAQ